MSQGHLPLSVCTDITVATISDHADNRTHGNNISKLLKWDDASMTDLWRYNRGVDSILSSLLPPTITLACSDLNCHSSEHKGVITDCCKAVENCLRNAGAEHIPSQAPRRNRPVIPGWNNFVSEKRAAALEAFRIWKENDRPLTGLIWEVKRRTQAQFKWAVKQCRLLEKQTRADKAASALLRSSKLFWKEIDRQSTAKLPRAPNIGSSNTEQDIANDFAKLYKDTFNSVRDNDVDVDFVKNAFDAISHDSRVSINVSDVSNHIHNLTKGKASGTDDISPEHLIYASKRLHVVLCLLFNCMLVHGYVPNNLMHSYITPVVKNKCASLSDFSNYRPITISTIISKVFELCILDKIAHRVKLTDNQFGFQPKLGCEMCIYVLKETVHIYVSRDSPVFCAFLDASKAFDRVSHSKLFRLLCAENVPLCVTRLLHYWYTHQTVHVRWGNAVSTDFHVSNGVRQGSVLSPLLFNLYMKGLSERLNRVRAHCTIGEMHINHLFYADDICLIAPSVQGLRMLLKVCERYGVEFDIKFNPNKSHCVYFVPHGNRVCRFGDAVFFGEVINCVSKVTYLGHIISCDMSDEYDMAHQKRILYCRGNQLARAFSNCSDDVKCALFKAYCYNIYCNALWNVFRVEALRHVKVAYNTAFRLLFGYARHDSASNFFAIHRVNGFLAITRNAAYSLLTRVESSMNKLVSACSSNASRSVLRSRWRALLRPEG